ncbi:MAG: hypothetical protein H0X39_08385 [Actinobacteria bacterium]|nr:hypothetical protein [Actinomycetota bacterium]
MRVLVFTVLLGAATIATTAAPGSSASACAPRLVSAGYEQHLASVTGSGIDVLGRRLVARPGGPTYAAAARALPPLLFARTSGKRPLTRTGVYAIPSAQPGGAQGAGSAALHVADGSEILFGSTTGPRLSVEVGAARELFGSCVSRLTPARLGAGYLPVVQTSYVDAAGGRYTQESFTSRAADGATTVFVRITTSGGVVHVVTRGGALAARRTLTLAWRPVVGGRPQMIGEADYRAALDAYRRYWDARLSIGASISVPEQVVMNAERSTLIQNLMLTWRYSLGNPYEEFSFPESVDGAQVMAEFGFTDVASAMVRTSLTRRPQPYANWKMGEKLLGVATVYRLSLDRRIVTSSTPLLVRYVRSFAGQLARGDGLLGRERYSSDIPDSVLGFHAQAVAWQGLHEMARAWAATGHPGEAMLARNTAARLRSGLLRAVARSRQPVPGGARFYPVRLLEREQPYARLPASRDGSYWNLVAPYAFASGLLAGDPAGERAALRYLQTHGGRLLGLVRAGAFSLYGTGTAASGIDQVYGLNVARFLADLEEPDELDLSLYGQLAAGMTPRTFIAGEAASITPIAHAYYRSMYLPPNSVSNAAFLEALRSTVVHELRDGRGLELAYATPRAWLAPGKRIAVTNLATSFGPLAYSLSASATRISAKIAVPRIGGHTLRLRLRLPGHRHIASVLLGGKAIRTFDARTSTIDLTGRRSTLQLEVALAR